MSSGDDIMETYNRLTVAHVEDLRRASERRQRWRDEESALRQKYRQEEVAQRRAAFRKLCIVLIVVNFTVALLIRLFIAR